MDGNTDSESQPATPLYVLIPPSPLFAAHWSFFIPNLLDYDPISRRHEESNIGKRIHVSGDRLNGFQLEIIRNYDVSKHRSVGSRRYPVASIRPQSLRSATPTYVAAVGGREEKDEDEGGGYVDNTPVDGFEQVCVETEAPGPSLNRVSQATRSSDVKRAKTEVKDCQWWVRQVINNLAARGMLEPASAHTKDGEIKEPLDAVATLPVH